MTSFIGDISGKIEGSGRLLLPSIFKKQLTELEGRFIVKKDIYENCLILYPYDEWERQIEILRKNLNLYNREHSKFLREFYKDTAEISLDNNGRLLIPKRLQEIAGIKKEIYLLGLDTKIEIWAKEIYDNISVDNTEFTNLAQKILGDININE